MHVNVSAITQGLLSLAAVAATPTFTLIARWALKRTKLDRNRALVAEVTTAVRAAGGLAYNELTAASHEPASIDIKNRALARGLQHVLTRVPAALKALGYDRNTVAEMIDAELGRLLAGDTSVIAGPSASLQATIPPRPSVPQKATDSAIRILTIPANASADDIAKAVANARVVPSSSTVTPTTEDLTKTTPASATPATTNAV